jgi:MGT family glycosyltransferase
MATVVVGCSPQQSHVGPMLVVVRALVAGGHRVVVLTGRRFADRVAAAGAGFAALDPAADYDDRAQERAFPELAGTTGPAALRAAVRAVFLPQLPVQLADLEAVVAREAADAVVTEPLFLGAIAYAQRPRGTRLPVLAVGIFPLLADSRDTAPFGLGIRPVEGPLAPLGRVRNAILAAVVQRVVFGSLQRDVQRAFVSATGIDPGGVLLAAGLAVDAVAQCTVPAFEYPRSDLPATVRFVGPLLPPPPPEVAALPAWWPDLAGRTVVHVTQGTVATADPGELIVPTALALADRDVVVVAATGGRPVTEVLDRVAAAHGSVPANLRVAAWVPYDALLPITSVVVTNGGYGGVQTALAHGVPLVVAGTTEDKPEVAARVAWSGAGIDLRTARPSAAVLARAVDTVLERPRYRDSAGRIARAMAATDAGATITAMVEDLVG